MGAASSRPLRNLPKSLAHNQNIPTPSSIPNSPATPPNPLPVHDPPPDPKFLSNLAQLGQVRVHNPTVDLPPEAFRTKPSPSSLSSHSPTSSVTQPPNTISAQALSTLFHTLQSDQHAPTLAHAKHLVHQFNLDWDLYQRLALYVNNPTIRSQNHIQLTDNSVRILKQAIWVDPPYTSNNSP